MPAWKKAIEEARKKPRKPRRAAVRAETAEQQLSLPMADGDALGVSEQEAVPSVTARAAPSPRQPSVARRW